jgi:hypothetical protein
LHALLVLAWALVRTLLARLFGQTRGLAAFRENYDADRLPPATREERDAMPTMSGCIACGLCEFGSRGPMELALVGARATIDADAAELSIAKLSDETLRAREAICPTRVPLVAIARLVRERASQSTAQ